MNTRITDNRSFVVVAIASVAVLCMWAWQYISSAIQKGIADGASIRVSMKTSCSVSEDTMGTPHFSGCNSVL